MERISRAGIAGSQGVRCRIAIAPSPRSHWDTEKGKKLLRIDADERGSGTQARAPALHISNQRSRMRSPPPITRSARRIFCRPLGLFRGQDRWERWNEAHETFFRRLRETA